MPRRGKDVSHMLIHERGWIDEAQSTERRTFFKNLPLLQTASDFPLEGTPSPCGVGSNDGNIPWNPAPLCLRQLEPSFMRSIDLKRSAASWPIGLRRGGTSRCHLFVPLCRKPYRSCMGFTPVGAFVGVYPRHHPWTRTGQSTRSAVSPPFLLVGESLLLTPRSRTSEF